MDAEEADEEMQEIVPEEGDGDTEKDADEDNEESKAEADQKELAEFMKEEGIENAVEN